MHEDREIEVIAYSGYKAEESPRFFFLDHEKIEVLRILRMWVEEGIEDRRRKRFFRVRASDGYNHTLYYDEGVRSWFLTG
ncbi:MAG: hypothetical protein P8013_14185 [Candidatus Sulfobium sp.]